jgi:hypothetical protein
MKVTMNSVTFIVLCRFHLHSLNQSAADPTNATNATSLTNMSLNTMEALLLSEIWPYFCSLSHKIQHVSLISERFMYLSLYQNTHPSRLGSMPLIFIKPLLEQYDFKDDVDFLQFPPYQPYSPSLACIQGELFSCKTGCSHRPK